MSPLGQKRPVAPGLDAGAVERQLPASTCRRARTWQLPLCVNQRSFSGRRNSHYPGCLPGIDQLSDRHRGADQDIRWDPRPYRHPSDIPDIGKRRSARIRSDYHLLAATFTVACGLTLYPPAVRTPRPIRRGSSLCRLRPSRRPSIPAA